MYSYKDGLEMDEYMQQFEKKWIHALEVMDKLADALEKVNENQKDLGGVVKMNIEDLKMLRKQVNDLEGKLYEMDNDL